MWPFACQTPEQFSQLFLHPQCVNQGWNQSVGNYSSYYQGTIPPLPPCYCSCPVHAPQSQQMNHQPNWNTQQPAINDPEPIQEEEYEEAEFEEEDENESIEEEEEEMMNDSDEEVQTLLEGMENDEQAETPAPEIKWASADELLVEFYLPAFDDLPFTHHVDSTNIERGSSFGLLWGKVVDDKTLRVEQFDILQTYSTKESLPFKQFNQNVIQSIFQSNPKQDQRTVIGWFRTNYGLGEILPQNIITVRKSFKSIDNASERCIPDWRDLVAIIDRSKTTPVPCMEVYDLRRLIGSECVPVLQAGVAYSLDTPE